MLRLQSVRLYCDVLRNQQQQFSRKAAILVFVRHRKPGPGGQSIGRCAKAALAMQQNPVAPKQQLEGNWLQHH